MTTPLRVPFVVNFVLFVLVLRFVSSTASFSIGGADESPANGRLMLVKGENGDWKFVASLSSQNSNPNYVKYAEPNRRNLRKGPVSVQNTPEPGHSSHQGGGCPPSCHGN